MRTASVLLGVAGLALATLLVGWFGFGRVANALAQVGWCGFGLYAAFHVALFGVLGGAWCVLTRKPALERFWVFVWGRMVRDAGGRLLPFSQIGGFVLGARAITLHGVKAPVATATTIADVTTEFIAEIAFAIIGLLVLAAYAPDSTLLTPIAWGTALAVVATTAFVWAQRGAAGLFRAIGWRVAGERFAPTSSRLDRVEEEMQRIYADPLRLALAVSLHLLGWIGTGIGSWIGYRLLGAPITLPMALAIEALLHVALTMTFFVPGGAGVQEAAYAALGSIFGLPPDVSLAVSLMNRAREILVGVPVLIVWQGIEVQRVHAARDG